MVLILLGLMGLWSTELSAFVLLSGNAEARLPVSIDNPRLVFELSINAPLAYDKDDFLDGAYADLSDEDFWFRLVQLAMETWNGVPDAYVDMDVSFSDQAGLDKEDRVFSIVVGKTGLTSAAYADPTIEDGTIVDCDIAVSERSTSARYLAFTLLHELGHCLGLGHNHSDYSAVMSYSRSDSSLNLGLDDEAGLIYLYPVATVGKPRELAACGVLSPALPQANWLPFFLLAPICLPIGRRIREKFHRRT